MSSITHPGVFYRRDRLYAFNLGTNPILLCRKEGVLRLSVDHGRPAQTNDKRWNAARTSSMKEYGSSRIVELSHDENVAKQRAQLTSLPLKEVQNSLVVQVDAFVGRVLSDTVINT